MNKSKTILLTSILYFSLLMSACQNNAANITATPSPSPVATPTATVAPTPTLTPSATPAAGKSVLTESGTYNGRIDSNFIEVTLANNEFKSCRLSEKLKEGFDKLPIKEGDKITFEYTVINDQYVIQSIKIKK